MKVSPVRSYDEYRSIVKGRKLINNGFLPNEIKNYILHQRLFFSYKENLLFLFYDEANYYQLVCESIGREGTPFSVSFELVKPVVCHIVDNNKNNQISSIMSILRASGFLLRCTIHEYVLDDLVSVSSADNKAFILSGDIKNLSECQNILSLWQENLPLYEITYMLPEDILALAGKNQAICLKDSHTGQLAGACYYDVFLGTTTIHHIVIDPTFRGRGCAGILLTAWLRQAGQSGAKTARSWIEDTNYSSQKSFSKIGFVKTSNVSYQFIKI